MSTISRMNKLCVHTVGYYTAMKTNELLLQATWMNLKNMMLSKRSGTQKNADCLHRGPLGSRVLMIPPLLTLPPPWGWGPVWSSLGLRSGPCGCGWWCGGSGVNAQPPFPGPGHSSPSRGSFHKHQRCPRRLQSWSLVKNTCPPKDEPKVMEDKADYLVCCNFAKKSRCQYGELCHFYHPHINKPPLWDCFPIRAGSSPLWLGGHIFPCGPVTAAVILFHQTPPVSDAHHCPPPLPFGSRVVFLFFMVLFIYV